MDFKKSKTPYFLFDLATIRNNINLYSDRKFALQYSVKGCLFDGLIEEIEKSLDGFTVASIKDLETVRKKTKKPIHFVSPMIREAEIKAINSMGDAIIFNSLNQFHQHEKLLSSKIKTFIRINPEKSFLSDDRYNPCKPYSQLGVPLSLLTKHLKTKPLKIDGIHFHNNSLSNDPEQVKKTMNHIEYSLGEEYLQTLSFINMGGGYLYNRNLLDLLNDLNLKWNKKYGINCIIEPSFDITNSAGSLVSSVVDIFKRQDKTIAVLDTSVNHLPLVFECGYHYDVLNQTKSGHSYILCGCTCLAGDVFGEYSFENPLKVGDPITFQYAGSYSYVKSSEFNGIKRPNLFVKNKTVSKNYKNRNFISKLLHKQ